MSMNNNVRLIGNLTANPTTFEWKNRAGEKKIGANYTLAINEGTGDNQSVTYIDIINYNGANDANYLKKGNLVMVDGSIQISKYKTESGENRQAFKINADNVRYFTPKTERTNAKQANDQIEAE
jgi:single-strand DNA-binding protein